MFKIKGGVGLRGVRQWVLRRDIDDINEINDINAEIVKTLSKKNKNYDVIDFGQKYAIDYNNFYVYKNKIIKKKGKIKKKKKLGNFI